MLVSVRVVNAYSVLCTSALSYSQEENRNLNRAKQQHQKKQTDADTKTYRGPDKGKGGRLIGPDGRYLPTKKGGKKGKGKAGEQQNENGKDAKPTTANGSSNGKAATEQSKIQQKRKNKNKAKIANHHRKDRAQKKAAQGM